MLNGAYTSVLRPIALQSDSIAQRSSASLVRPQGIWGGVDHSSIAASSGTRAVGHNNGQPAIPPIANIIPRMDFSAYESLGEGSYLVPGSGYSLVVVVSPEIHAVSVYAIPSTEVNVPVSTPGRGAMSVLTGTEFTGVMNPLAVASEMMHPEPQIAPGIVTNVALDERPQGSGLSIALVWSSTGTTVGQSIGLPMDCEIVQQVVGAMISYEAPVTGNLIALGINAATNFQQLASHKKGALATPSSIAEWPVQKASFAAMPLNIKGVEKSLEKVIGELARMSTSVTSFFWDARHLTTTAVAATAIAGGGTAVYLRRRRSKQSLNRNDEEASSSWLFARLQSAPDS